jgi:hypothetical protein
MGKKLFKVIFVLLVLAGIAFSVSNFVAKDAYAGSGWQKFIKDKMECDGKGRDCAWVDPLPDN